MWKSGFATVCAALAAISTSGCQSWGPSAFPMNTMSRVSPPGTGTYTVPNGYYNQTSSLGSAPPGMTASHNNNQLAPVQGGLPSTNLAANGADSRSVLPAQFTSSPSGSGQAANYQAGNFETRDISSSANATFSDAPDVTADPELQWRP